MTRRRVLRGYGEDFGQPVYPPGDKSVLGCTQAGVYFRSPEGQKGNSGLIVFCYEDTHRNSLRP